MIRAEHKILDDTLKAHRKYGSAFFTYLTLILASYLLAYMIGATNLDDPINIIGPVALFIGCCFMAYKLIRFDSANIWAPYPWFLVAVAIYFCIGPLLYIYGNSETIYFVQRTWPLHGSDLTFVNLLNFVGVYTVTIIVCMLPTNFLLNKNRGGPQQERVTNARYVTLLILVVGVIIKYVLVLPYEFGLSSQVLPGSLYALASLMKLALFLLGFMSSRHRGVWVLLLVIVGTVEFTTDFLRFSKKELLMTVIMPFIGIYYHSRKSRILIYGGVIVIFLYVVYSPLVHSGRAGITRLSGNHYTATLSQRAGIALNILKEDSISSGTEDRIQRWWTRLNYASVQNFAVHRYDSSYPGDSYKYALYTFIPRIIWRDKPIMTSSATDFTMLYVGHRGSATGLSIFAEAYWNGGWLYVIIISVLIGVMFVAITRISLGHLHGGNFIFLPVVFLGLKIGVNVSNWFVSGYLGAFVIYIGYNLIASSIVNKKLRWTP